MRQACVIGPPLVKGSNINRSSLVHVKQSLLQYCPLVIPASVDGIPMAELGTIAAIVGIATAGVQIANGLYKIAEALKSAGTDVRNIADEVSLLSDVLENLGKELRKNSAAAHQPPASYDGSLAKKLINLCERLNMKSQELIEVLKPLLRYRVGNRKRHEVTRTILRIRWLFERSKFADHRAALEHTKTTLILLMDTMTYAAISELHSRSYGSPWTRYIVYWQLILTSS
jgi:hypothetical protein